MASVKRFEDLICWQEGRKLVNLIYKITSKRIFTDFSLKDQIRRATVSTISNIAEGFERGSKEEFIYFLYIAKGSCGEVRTQLYVALDQKFVGQQDFEKAYQLAKRISAMIYKLIEGLKGSKYKGLKYKQTPREDLWEKFMKEKHPEILQQLREKHRT